MKLNSVIFHTNRLSEIRNFYENQLGLSIGTYVKENRTVPDYSETYINYHLDGALLCFEIDENRTDIGTVVLSVPDFTNFRTRLEGKGIKIAGGNEHFFKIKDPEG